MSNYTPDQSVITSDQDHFQRYQFAKRIAQTVSEFKLADGFVIGVYGKWGEGKTSLLSFVETELKPNQGCIIVHFNPWRFGDETVLITTFFQALATSLKEKLYTRKERFFGFVKGNEPLFDGAPDLLNNIAEYGKLSTSFVGSISGVASIAGKAGKSKAEVSVETLKERIEKLLEKNKKRILIVIDDIDRLEVDEIRAIFRLVKLTGNFKYTTYLLAFDDTQVSRVLARSLGSDDLEVGNSYLEKIIQVPLRLPMATKADMYSYCMDRINALIKDYNLPPEELNRLDSCIKNDLLPALMTPRMVVRLVNACSFSVPLMNGLVNLVDLILVESLKVLFPILYEVIRENRDSLVSIEGKKIIHASPDYDKEITESLTKACDAYNEQSSAARSLMISLFPETTRYFGEPLMYSRPDISKIDLQMRVCSEDYFERFFTYSVIKGDIPDTLLKETLSKLNDDRALNTRILEDLFKKYGASNVVYKLDQKEIEFTQEAIERLVGGLIDLATFFPRDINESLHFSLSERAAKFICNCILRVEEEKREKLLTESILESTPREFGFSILRYLAASKSYDKLGVKIEQKALERKFLREMLNANDPLELVGRLPLDSRYLLFIWSEENRPELDAYISALLEKAPKQVINLIKAFTPYNLYRGTEEINFINFGQGNFAEMKQTISLDVVAKTIVANFGSDYSNPKLHIIDDVFEVNTDVIMLKQFMSLYNDDTRKVSIRENKDLSS